MSTEVATRTPAEELASRIASEGFGSQIEVVLPGKGKRFVRTALTALRQNPELATWNQPSVMTALLRAAQDGLMPDGRQAALMPFRNSDTGEIEAQYVPMILGLRMVASKYGFSLNAHPVFANDLFVYTLGAEPSVQHEPPALGKERGGFIGAYATAKDPNTGELLVDVMDKAEIDKVRKVSKMSDKGPWRDWYEEMARKTVARRLFKQLPLGELDEISERIVVQADADVELESVEETEHRALSAATDVPPVDVAAAIAEDVGVDGGRPPAEAAPEPAPSALGDVVITAEGAHNGKTLKEVYDGPRGEYWLRWCASQQDHPQHAEAAAYLEATQGAGLA